MSHSNSAYRYKYGVKWFSADLVRKTMVHLPKIWVRWVTAELLGKHWIKAVDGTQTHRRKSTSGPVRKTSFSSAVNIDFHIISMENLLQNYGAAPELPPVSLVSKNLTLLKRINNNKKLSSKQSEQPECSTKAKPKRYQPQGGITQSSSINFLRRPVLLNLRI